MTDQEILTQTFRTILELGGCLIRAQSDHGKTWPGQEMRHQKCQKNVDFWKFDVFLRMNPDQPKTISSLKKHHLDPKIDDFQMKN